MELQFYRHKEYKDKYLVRSGACGGGPDSQFYVVTSDVIQAIQQFERYKKAKEPFEYWFIQFPETKTKAIFEKEIEFDGYKGKLIKEVYLNVSDFELVTLGEKNDKI